VRLHKGLRSIHLRQRLDIDLVNDYMSFEQFRDRVLHHHKQLVSYYGSKYDKDETDDINSGLRRSKDNSTRARTAKEYTPRSTTSRDRSYSPRRSSVNYVDNDGSESDYSVKHLLAIKNDVTGFTCFRCNKAGHSAKNCPELQPANLDSRCKICGNPAHTTDDCRINTDRLVCHRCNNPGHLAYVCGTKLQTPPPSRVTTGQSTNRSSTSGTGKGSGPKPTTKGKVNTNVHATFLNNGTAEVERHCYTLRSSRTRPPTPDPRVRHREGMMTGYVTIEETEVTAIYDTGADVSLITAECLNYVAPDADLEPEVINTLSAANGGHLHTIGNVRLRVSTTRVSAIDNFLVTTVPLSHPVILGCPTMSRLRTRITISPAGYHIGTNWETKTTNNKVRFNDYVDFSARQVEDEAPAEDDSNAVQQEDDLDKYDYITNYKINCINQLCHLATLAAELLEV
ncbi:hypothetical protein FOL46_002742, partial [Perkinsus olseni]